MAVILRSAFSFLTVCLLTAALVCIQPAVAQTSSVLTAPSNRMLALYRRDYELLSPGQQMKVRLYGLRFAALHPTIWGLRRVDRTENRDFVPIRPFFLRSSVSPSYRLKRISIVFRFLPVEERHMRAIPSQKTPLFDINFAGSYRKGPAGERPETDRGHTLRLSAAPSHESGLYFKSFARYLLLTPAAPRRLSPGVRYELALKAEPSAVAVFLNSEPFCRLEGDFRAGLISLISGWHPLEVERLQVDGSDLRQGRRVELFESGLLPLEAAGQKPNEPQLDEVP